MAECKACRANIIWAKTEKGKPIPLDAEPREDGNIYLFAGVAHYGDAPAAMGHVDKYVTHFVSCPQAGLFRKKTADGGP